jgi:hypothetical protein
MCVVHHRVRTHSIAMARSTPIAITAKLMTATVMTTSIIGAPKVAFKIAGADREFTLSLVGAGLPSSYRLVITTMVAGREG